MMGVTIRVLEGDLERLTIDLGYERGQIVATLGTPTVGETLTVEHDGPDGQSSVAYIVHARHWVAQVSPVVLRMTGTIGMVLELHVHPASDPLPPYVCGECGRRFPTEEDVVQHAATRGHDGTAWRVDGAPAACTAARAARRAVAADIAAWLRLNPDVAAEVDRLRAAEECAP
jgi:hypothetical protein